MDTLVIGLDGGDWDVIDPLIASGELPNLARLREDGISGELESTVPPVSPPAWTSIHTGKNPGKHGICDFNRYDEKYRRRTINATDRRAPPFWRVMNDASVSTGLFKVPFTYPVDDLDGFAVSGFPTPSTVSDFVIPEALASEFESPTELFEDWSHIHEGAYEAFAEDIHDVAERQTELFLDLVDRYDTDFLMTVYDGSDRIQHFYWKYLDKNHPRYTHDSILSDAIPGYYRIVDEGIGELLDTVDSDTDVVVLSDHGFGPLSKDIRIDEWLDDNGFLSQYETDTAKGAWVSAASKVVDIVWSAVEQLTIADEIKRILPQEVVLSGGQLRNKPERAINWRETTAFFTNLSGQAIHVNLEGRFSQGVVSTIEYDDVVADLSNALLELRDPETGERVVREVYHRDDVYTGAAVEDLPDLVVETEPEYTLQDGTSDVIVEPSTQHGQDRSGDHRPEGIFIANGPSFERGTVADASVIDIAPTLLHLHDCPVPESMDGDILVDALREGKSDIKYTSEYEHADSEHREWTDEEANELESRLQDMGYIE